MPGKKGKNKAASQSPAAGTAAMYDMIPGPGYRIQAPLTVLKEHRKHNTYSAAGLCETVGRVGHFAFLSPDQQTICVVGGDAVRADDDEARAGWSPAVSSSDDDDLDTPASSIHGVVPVSGGRYPEDTPPAVTSTTTTTAQLEGSPSGKTTARSAGADSKLSTPAPLSNTPAPPPGSPSPIPVPSTAPPTKAGGMGGQLQGVGVGGASSSSVVRRNAPPAIPAEFRTDFPLIECFRLHSGTWYIPNGERKRSSACQGLIRWPTQSGALVAWGGAGGHSGAGGWDSESLTGPLHTGKPPLAAPISQTATPVRPTPPTATPPPAGGSGRTGSRTTSPATTPERRAGAVPTAGPPPPQQQQQQLTPAQTPPQRDDSPARGLPDISLLATRRRSKWDGPSAVWVIGGWDGLRRLSTLLDYNVGNPTRQEGQQLQHRRVGPSGSNSAFFDENAELILTSIPQVVDLPVLPPVTHATATLVKDRWYVFGGNTVSGALDDLYVVEGNRLREAMLESQRVGDFLGGVSTGETQVWGGAGGAGGNNAISARRGSRQRSSQMTQVHHPSGWDCKPISGAACAGMGAVNTTNSTSSPLRDSDMYGDHEVSAVFSANSRATPSNFGGTASMMIGASTAAASPPVTVKNNLPGPAPRSSHAAVALHGRYLIIFGGRQLVLPHTEPAGRSRSKSVQRKAPVAKKGGKEGKDSHKGGKGNKLPPPPVDEDEEMLPTLKLLDDLAVYDTELRGWVQVRVVGSDHPPARYGAAMCVIPPPPAATATSHAFESLQEVSVGSINFQPHRRNESSNSNASSLGPKEVVLHGGFGEKDVILNDMWVLQAIGRGQGGSLVEVDATSGVPTLRVRWVRVQREALPADSAENSRTSSVPLAGGVVASSHSNNNNNNTAPVSAVVPPGGAAVAPSGPGATLENPIAAAIAPVELPPPEFPARAQHAIVATSERDVYVVGGVQPFARGANQHHHSAGVAGASNNVTAAAALGSGESKLHPCVTTDRTEVVKISLPTLDAVTEVALHRKGSLYKAKK